MDQVIGFLRILDPVDQAHLGLSWVASLVLENPSRVAGHSFLLTSWLIEMRSASAEFGEFDLWQKTVDALVVEGVTQLAHFAE